MRREVVFRIAGRCCDDGIGVEIEFAVLAERLVVVCRVDIELDANLLQAVLCRLCEQWELLPRGVSEIAELEVFAVFIHVAIAICVFVTGFLEQGSCPIEIVGGLP